MSHPLKKCLTNISVSVDLLWIPIIGPFLSRLLGGGTSNEDNFQRDKHPAVDNTRGEADKKNDKEKKHG